MLPTENLEAYTLLSVAWYNYAESSNPLESMPLVDRALAIDPAYAWAHCVKATFLYISAEFGYAPSKEALEKARLEINVAIALQPENGMFYSIVGILNDRLDLDYSAAVKAFREAEALGAPIGWRAGFEQDTLLNAGLYEEGLRLYEAWEALNPEDAQPKIQQGRFLYRLGRSEEAFVKFEAALKLAPRNVWVVQQVLAHDIFYDVKNLDRAERRIESLEDPSVVEDFIVPGLEFYKGNRLPLDRLVAGWIR